MNKQTEEGKPKGNAKKWIPTNIARIIEGLTSVEEIRAKFNAIGDTNAEHGQDTNGQQVSTTDAAGGQNTSLSALNSDQHSPIDMLSLAGTTDGGQEAEHSNNPNEAAEGAEAGGQEVDDWTPVAPGKVARRVRNKYQNSKDSDNDDKAMETEHNTEFALLSTHHGDGNPLIPSDQ
ncbi:unnamed protein product [Amaranthus hypochondriacus]